MNTPVLEQAVATVEALFTDGSITTSQVLEGESAMDPMVQAELVAAAMARKHTKAVVTVEGDHAARELAARRIDPFDLLGRPRCTCPKTYRLMTFFSGKNYPAPSHPAGRLHPAEPLPAPRLLSGGPLIMTSAQAPQRKPRRQQL